MFPKEFSLFSDGLVLSYHYEVDLFFSSKDTIAAFETYINYFSRPKESSFSNDDIAGVYVRKKVSTQEEKVQPRRTKRQLDLQRQQEAGGKQLDLRREREREQHRQEARNRRLNLERQQQEQRRQQQRQQQIDQQRQQEKRWQQQREFGEIYFPFNSQRGNTVTANDSQEPACKRFKPA